MKICTIHSKFLKKFLTCVTLIEFWKLNATCCISPEIAELRIWLTLKWEEADGWRERNDHLLSGVEQAFGNVFERRKSKCCGVLMKHWRKVKGEQGINLQMTQILMLNQGNYFVVSIKLNFPYRQRLIALMMKIKFNEKFDLITSFYVDENFSRQMLGKMV